MPEGYANATIRCLARVELELAQGGKHNMLCAPRGTVEGLPDRQCGLRDRLIVNIALHRVPVRGLRQRSRTARAVRCIHRLMRPGNED